MKVINSIELLRSVLQQKRHQYSIGLVPTMGALHQGHISLVEKAKKENDVVVVSIFINPTQFNNSEDLEKYPKTLNEDAKLLEKADVDYIFAPNANEIYPDKHILGFSAGYLDSIMEGSTRPGHFSGVTQIVAKLFNIVQPNNAYFGQKDLQQLTLIKRLATELCFDINIIGCPIIREENGLAMSSRNRRLSTKEKETATCLYKALQLVATEIQNGAESQKAIEKATTFINQFKDTRIEYIDIAEATYLTPINTNTKEIAICIACYVGEIRLIDNLVFTKKIVVNI